MLLRQYCYLQYIQFIRTYYQINADESTESNKETIVNFLIELHKKVGLAHIGQNYIYDYLVYQFNYWCDKDVQFGDRITIKKVFAVASLNRYLKRPSDFNWYNARKQIEPFLTPLEEKINKREELNQTEENEKRRFYNKRQGLSHCFEITTLFNHKSELCNGCRFGELCKKLLMNNYPNIYKERGYE